MSADSRAMFPAGQREPAGTIVAATLKWGFSAMAFPRQVVGLIGVAAGGWLGLVSLSALAQGPPQPQHVEIPADAATLEGTPIVRIDSAEGSTTRRVLGEAEAAKNRLTVRVVDGQFYWASRGNRGLRLNQSGEFTYLSSEPGTYIKFTRLNDKIAYVEHVDLGFDSITWWGELKFAVGK